jgi:hypothetical protein
MQSAAVWLFETPVLFAEPVLGLVEVVLVPLAGFGLGFVEVVLLVLVAAMLLLLVEVLPVEAPLAEALLLLLRVLQLPLAVLLLVVLLVLAEVRLAELGKDTDTIGKYVAPRYSKSDLQRRQQSVARDISEAVPGKDSLAYRRYTSR